MQFRQEPQRPGCRNMAEGEINEAFRFLGRSKFSNHSQEDFVGKARANQLVLSDSFPNERDTLLGFAQFGQAYAAKERDESRPARKFVFGSEACHFLAS